jgi:hypothetical protein
MAGLKRVRKSACLSMNWKAGWVHVAQPARVSMQ